MQDSTNARTTSDQIPQALSAALGSALTQIKPLSSSETGQKPSGQNIMIGKPLSETLLQDLRRTAQQADHGAEVTDSQLQALLMQHFGSRLALKPKTIPIYSEAYGYDEKTDGYEITLEDGLGSAEGKIADFVATLVRPGKLIVIAGMVAKMRVSLMRRQEVEQDIEILIDTVVNFLSAYPTDIVVSVCNHCIKTMKFFPLVKELTDLCDARMTMRRSLHEFFTRKAPMITASAPAESPRSWKDLPKPRWAAEQWAAYCADALAMAEQARRYPAALDPDFWVTETARRRVEAGEAGFAQAEAC